MQQLVASILSALEHYQFLRHRDILKQKLCEAVDRLEAPALLDRWRAGEKEHGSITPEILAAMDVDAMFDEEVADAFWYHVLQERKDGKK